MSKPISQREARALKKRVAQLENMQEQQRRSWALDYPGGTHIGTVSRTRDWLSGRIEASRMLGHAVVVTYNGDGSLNFYALPLARATDGGKAHGR